MKVKEIDEQEYTAVLTSAADIDVARRPLTHGQRCGKWAFDAKLLTLTHCKSRYVIDVEKFTSSAALLDTIFQVKMKLWCTKKDAGNLLEAIRELVDPQAHLCSMGVDRRFDVTAHLRQRISSE